MPQHQGLTVSQDASSALQACTRPLPGSSPLLAAQAVLREPTGLAPERLLPRPAPCAMLDGIRLASLSRPHPPAPCAWRVTTQPRPACKHLRRVRPAPLEPTVLALESPRLYHAPYVYLALILQA